MYRSCGIAEVNYKINKDVTLIGWLHNIRIHSKIVFFELRDASGILQCVMLKSNEIPNFDLPPLESVIQVDGRIILRNEKFISENALGNIELVVQRISTVGVVRNDFGGQNAVKNATQATKFTLRYIDLRQKDRMQHIINRSLLVQSCHAFFTTHNFVHVETPILTKSTPEGARDFIVFSRNHPGAAYALPQSPQLFKQLLMISGLEKYYQIARCFRDEDPRANRQAEFTQLDIECSFYTQRELMNLIESLLEHIFIALKIEKSWDTIPVMDYEVALKLYGSDCPDLSIENMKLYELESNHVALLSPVDLDDPAAYLQQSGIGNCDSIQIYSAQDIFELTAQTSDNDRYAFVTTKNNSNLLAKIRAQLAYDFKLHKNGFYPVWIVNFPMFTLDINSKIQVSHHPFTAIELKDINMLESDNILSLKGKSFDLVINGQEVGGGSVREINSSIVEKVFNILGYSPEYIHSNFGFFLQALNSGTPPHCGFAIGLERLMMTLYNLSDIRDIIAFPKSGSGQCYLTKAPSMVEKQLLTDLRIDIDKTVSEIN